MSSAANVLIHSSQFPENVRRDLLESLRTRRVNHKFHYDNVKQTQKWLALHEAHSPSRNDRDGAAIYEQSFRAAMERAEGDRVHVLGLGCGGGQKDAQLLKLLKAHRKELLYTPCDVSVAMVLVARQAALGIVADENCSPFVCDLATAVHLPSVFDHGITHHVSRITTFFGMIPNFEPNVILPKLVSLVGPDDLLLFSANLAPGSDYTGGMKKILPQYDNALTRDWLMIFLLDLGVERDDGALDFSIEPGEQELRRVVAHFKFERKRRIEVDSESFAFKPGDSIRLFYSYRYTPDRVRELLGRHQLCVLDEWITRSQEEGVFLCQRSGGGG